MLADHHKLRLNPLSRIAKPDPNSDRRHERRMLLPDEWTWLELALKDAPDRNSMTAKERSMLYQLAIQTGLRSREIEGLSRGKVVLAGKSPHVLCKAAGTKNRKPAKQYIDEQLAAELSEHLATKHPTAPLFSFGSARELSRVLAQDLAEARRLWLGSLKGKERIDAESSDFLLKKNHDGEHLVFHSLRHTCGAWLAMDGEHVKSMQMVMRHGTVTLTIDRYGHLFPGQVEGAASRIADIMRGKRVGVQATALRTNG